MNPRLLGALGKLDPLVLRLAMLCVLGFAAYEGWYLALRKPVQEYRRVVAMRTAMATALSAPEDAQGDLSRLAAELSRLSDRLAGELRLPAADDQMVASLMTELERSARTQGIALTGIRPGARRRVLSFQEASFDITATGKYVALSQWLMGFEGTLSRSATVTNFAMKSVDGGRQVALTATVALYRALPSAGAGT